METPPTNSDYPNALGNGSSAEEEARDPVPFPEPEYGGCIRVVALVEEGNTQTVWTRANPGGSDGEESSDSSSDDDSDIEMDDDSFMDSDDEDEDKNFLVILEGGQEAFWLHRVKREAIYGKVWFASVVRRRPNNPSACSLPNNDMVIWDVTGEKCAVKEMPWYKIRNIPHTEDPVKEAAALQHLQRWHAANNNAENNNTALQDSLNNNVVMPREVLSDGIFLYIITPYFVGGEIFNCLFDEGTGRRYRFGENESRYWMGHILNGIETLQRAGICHRDLSIENFMIHENRCIVIDMGMCLRIPYCEQQQHRFLMRPQRPCGKWRSMSPEIGWHERKNAPFDGHAVDMWAVGTILFSMLVGFVHTNNAHEKALVLRLFREFSKGRVVDALRDNLPDRYRSFSPELLDLLQKMFWFDARNRFCLHQVRSHDWMNGPRQAPQENRDPRLFPS